jgi:hypothetical protein
VWSVVTTGACIPSQQGQYVAAGRPAEYAELVLERDQIHAAGVQEVRRSLVRVQLLLLNLEANGIRILVRPLGVVDRDREALALGMPRCHRSEQVRCKSGNAALARHVVAQESDGSNAGFCSHL